MSNQISSKTVRLTVREKKLFELVLLGKSLTDAAREAGYSQKWPGQAGHQALENIKRKAPTLFGRHGLDEDAFIEKHIKPALEATEVKVHFVSGDKKKPGRFIYSKPLPVWGPRVAMIRLVAEMMGLLVKQQETPNAGVKVIVVNQAHRPKPRPAIDVKSLPQIPGLLPLEKPN